jgi:hypothetical protein
MHVRVIIFYMNPLYVTCCCWTCGIYYRIVGNIFVILYSFHMKDESRIYYLDSVDAVEAKW